LKDLTLYVVRELGTHIASVNKKWLRNKHITFSCSRKLYTGLPACQAIMQYRVVSLEYNYKVKPTFWKEITSVIIY
jgi:hypothetical protein